MSLACVCRKVAQVCPRCLGERTPLMYFRMVRQAGADAEALSNSPRMRSAPHRRLSLAISANQGDGLLRDPWRERSCLRLVFPKELETLAMEAATASRAGQ